MAKTDAHSTGYAVLSDREFDKFRKLIFEKSGISLGSSKKELVRTRLGSRLRSGGFTSFMDYLNHVEKDTTGTEVISLLDSISTNLTSFFREINHFNFLINTVIPDIVRSKGNREDKEIRIWSAGCSTGEEPYSLAFTLMDQLETIKTWRVKILATDLSTSVLEHATKGIYKEDRVKTMPPGTIRKYFQIGSNENAGYYKIRPEVKSLVHFKRFNLNTETFPFKKEFDFIFCRNVMIYFDKPTQEKLVNKFHNVLRRGGILMIGHSESLTGVNHKFKYLQPTTYQKSEQ